MSHLHLLFKLNSINQSHTSPEPFAPSCLLLRVGVGHGHPCQHADTAARVTTGTKEAKGMQLRSKGSKGTAFQRLCDYSFRPATEPAEWSPPRKGLLPPPPTLPTASLVPALTFTQLLGMWVIANWPKKTNSLFSPPFLLGTVTASSPECHTMLK